METRLAQIENYWRAANYVTCALLYLQDNVLLREELEPRHFKEKIVGHWGTCPGVNAIIAHLNYSTAASGRNIRVVVGTGHAGPALAANLFLDGSLERQSPDYSRDEAGLRQLAGRFGTSEGLETEISPSYPGIDYFGGELGRALAFSQGCALNDPECVVACIVGDGELESALAQSSWQGFRLLSKHDGRVIPIVNANGFRMGSRSLFSLMGRDDLEAYFQAHGLRVHWATDHCSLADAMDVAFAQSSPGCCEPNPVVVFRSPKGWTAPESLGGERYVGTRRAHKPSLRHPASSQKEMAEIRAWLESYSPESLFDRQGRPSADVTSILSEGESLFRTRRFHRPHLNEDSCADGDSSAGATTASPNDTLCASLMSMMRSDRYRDLMVFSPDELASNRYGALMGATSVRYSRLVGGAEPPMAPDGRVIEVLNEQLCFELLHGYCASGRRGVFICYEAFAPLCDSQTEQLLKHLEARSAGQPSVNIVLTSLGWENTPSHHNPGFVDSLIGRELNSLRVFTPVAASDAEGLLVACLESTDRLNVIVVGKHPRPNVAQVAKSTRWAPWRALVEGSSELPVLVAVGDTMAEECLAASRMAQGFIEGRVAVYGLNELSFLTRTVSSEMVSFIEEVERHPQVLWAYPGYPRSIKACLWDIATVNKHVVLGYLDRSRGAAGRARLEENLVGRDAIVERLRAAVGLGS